jgi:hypothetical protein
VRGSERCMARSQKCNMQRFRLNQYRQKCNMQRFRLLGVFRALCLVSFIVYRLQTIEILTIVCVPCFFVCPVLCAGCKRGTQGWPQAPRKGESPKAWNMGPRNQNTQSLISNLESSISECSCRTPETMSQPTLFRLLQRPRRA